MTWSELVHSYTYQTMLAGSVLVGLTTGLLGCLLYLRRQALVADVVGHAAIAGVAGSFLVAASLGADGRSLPVLMAGAAIAGLAAVGLTSLITRHSPLGPDTAMAISLSTLFGAGMVMLRAIAHSRLQHRGGLEKIAFGNAATITHEDLTAVAITAVVVVVAVIVVWRPLLVLLFDPVLAATTALAGRGMRVLLILLVTAGLVVGAKTTGLMLMVGLVMLPPAAARQWVSHAWTMAVLSATLGGLGGAVGSVLAVALGRVPTGPVVLLVLFVAFLVSLMVGRPWRARVGKGVPA